MQQVYEATDVGLVRKGNEDNFAVFDAVYVVADGMGGHKAGDYASRYTTQRVVASVSRDPGEEPVSIIKEAVNTANKILIEEAAEDAEAESDSEEAENSEESGTAAEESAIVDLDVVAALVKNKLAEKTFDEDADLSGHDETEEIPDRSSAQSDVPAKDIEKTAGTGEMTAEELAAEIAAYASQNMVLMDEEDETLNEETAEEAVAETVPEEENDTDEATEDSENADAATDSLTEEVAETVSEEEPEEAVEAPVLHVIPDKADDAEEAAKEGNGEGSVAEAGKEETAETSAEDVRPILSEEIRAAMFDYFSNHLLHFKLKNHDKTQVSILDLSVNSLATLKK